MRGVVVGEGDTYGEALADVRSAIQFHIETFGADAFLDDSPVLEAFVAETEVAV
jgi:predicted RNase H-like HicB family nuclease